MDDETREPGAGGGAKGEEMRQTTHQHKESIADRAINLGSDAGHATAEGAHNLAETIHDAVTEGIGHLFHHEHAPAPHEVPPAAGGSGTEGAPSTADTGAQTFDSRRDTPEGGSSGPSTV